jgi:hypothetical protein
LIETFIAHFGAALMHALIYFRAWRRGTHGPANSLSQRKMNRRLPQSSDKPWRFLGCQVLSIPGLADAG